MRTKIKQATTIIALLLLCTVFLSCMGGCTKGNNKIFDTDLFRCMYNDDKTGVIILELTEKGQEQEILVIPEEINGLPVAQLGGVTGYPNRAHILSGCAKKMYVGQNVSFGRGEIDMDNLVEIIIYPSIIYVDSFKTTFVSEIINVYVKKGIVGTGYLEMHGYHSSYNGVFKEANITFYSDSEEICFIDNYSPNNLYIEPFIPEKKGYVFTGWYLDSELKHEWDGSYPEEEKINVYIKWTKE